MPQELAALKGKGTISESESIGSGAVQILPTKGVILTADFSGSMTSFQVAAISSSIDLLDDKGSSSSSMSLFA